MDGEGTEGKGGRKIELWEASWLWVWGGRGGEVGLIEGVEGEGEMMVGVYLSFFFAIYVLCLYENKADRWIDKALQMGR